MKGNGAFELVAMFDVLLWEEKCMSSDDLWLG